MERRRVRARFDTAIDPAPTVVTCTDGTEKVDGRLGLAARPVVIPDQQYVT